MDPSLRELRRSRLRRRRLAAIGLVAAVSAAAGFVCGFALSGAPAGRAAGGSPIAAAIRRAAASPAASPSPSPRVPPAVRVVCGGDVMTDRAVKAYAAAHGADAVLRGIAPVLRRGDAAWVNLEGVVSTLGSPVAGKTYTFEGPPAMAPALAAAGIDVVTLGNNHALDYGRAALTDAIRRLEKAGVQVVGAGADGTDARRPAIVTTADGATIGFLAWNDIWMPGWAATRDKAGVAEAFSNVKRMQRDIRALARRVDYVVVGFHWGIEYQHYPIVQQTQEARAAIDAGADLVIGHHPHVLQGVATYRRGVIAYSLGDLVFDHTSLDTGQTVLVDAVLTPHGVTATLVPAYASSAGIPAVQHGGSATAILSLMRQYSAPFGTRVRIRGEQAVVRTPRR